MPLSAIARIEVYLPDHLSRASQELLIAFDRLDGLIARAFDWRSRLGASLDSTADVLVSLIAVAGVLVFQRDFLAAHYAPLLAVIALYLTELLAALWRYGRMMKPPRSGCRRAWH